MCSKKVVMVVVVGGGVSMGNIIVKNGFIKKGSLNDFDIYSSLIRMISVI